MSVSNGCIFNYYTYCSILNKKNCKGCKFKKTPSEWDEGQLKAEEILEKKGLEAYVAIDADGNKTVTTRPKGVTSIGL